MRQDESANLTNAFSSSSSLSNSSSLNKSSKASIKSSSHAANNAPLNTKSSSSSSSSSSSNFSSTSTGKSREQKQTKSSMASSSNSSSKAKKASPTSSSSSSKGEAKMHACDNEKQMVGGCCVCADDTGYMDNVLVYCDGEECQVAVHQGCYGITNVPDGPWFCRRCEHKHQLSRQSSLSASEIKSEIDKLVRPHFSFFLFHS